VTNEEESTIVLKNTVDNMKIQLYQKDTIIHNAMAEIHNSNYLIEGLRLVVNATCIYKLMWSKLFLIKL